MSFYNQITWIHFLYNSFVPADTATIGITDKIFTRIQTSETVSKVMSIMSVNMP
jgi:DNA mismatch repair protein MSH5